MSPFSVEKTALKMLIDNYVGYAWMAEETADWLSVVRSIKPGLSTDNRPERLRPPPLRWDVIIPSLANLIEQHFCPEPLRAYMEDNKDEVSWRPPSCYWACLKHRTLRELMINLYQRHPKSEFLSAFSQDSLEIIKESIGKSAVRQLASSICKVSSNFSVYLKNLCAALHLYLTQEDFDDEDADTTTLKVCDVLCHSENAFLFAQSVLQMIANQRAEYSACGRLGQVLTKFIAQSPDVDSRTAYLPLLFTNVTQYPQLYRTVTQALYSVGTEALSTEDLVTFYVELKKVTLLFDKRRALMGNTASPSYSAGDERNAEFQEETYDSDEGSDAGEVLEAEFETEQWEAGHWQSLADVAGDANGARFSDTLEWSNTTYDPFGLEKDWSFLDQEEEDLMEKVGVDAADAPRLKPEDVIHLCNPGSLTAEEDISRFVRERATALQTRIEGKLDGSTPDHVRMSPPQTMDLPSASQVGDVVSEPEPVSVEPPPLQALRSSRVLPALLAEVSSCRPTYPPEDRRDRVLVELLLMLTTLSAYELVMKAEQRPSDGGSYFMKGGGGKSAPTYQWEEVTQDLVSDGESNVGSTIYHNVFSDDHIGSIKVPASVKEYHQHLFSKYTKELQSYKARARKDLFTILLVRKSTHLSHVERLARLRQCMASGAGASVVFTYVASLLLHPPDRWLLDRHVTVCLTLLMEVARCHPKKRGIIVALFSEANGSR
ncbi:MAG: uncharacterized protein KVP18_003594 [Porospora cf. gigantea A]|uniref:uncharacterized protein n=1 Tax=Porospora cf. gigantea A TaxID=2853593 RepID=UPI00355A0286|nr:MAG: hypothetical protein KVP18_003594 [Porospora cf. gigantea A]